MSGCECVSSYPGCRLRCLFSGLGVEGLGLRVLGFRVSGLGFQGTGFRDLGLRVQGLRVQGFGFRIQGSWCRVQHQGFRYGIQIQG